MMREIEFRGKIIGNGEWVKGNLILQDKEARIITDYDEFGTTWVDCFCDEVDINTLGQYTGLKDKNGTKIFEGDVVKLVETNYDYEWTAIVEFGNSNGEYIWGWNLKPITKDVEYNLDILCWVEMPIGAICEVIGNIYDNPELIKGDEN